MFVCCPRQQPEPLERRLALRARKPREHFLDADGIEHRLGLAHPHAGLGNAQQHPPPIARVAVAARVAFALQPIDGQRHRRHGDAHVSGEVGHRHRVDLVEVVENAGLVGAERLARLRVVHVPGVAGEEDARVGLEHMRGRHDRVLYFALSNQNIIPKKRRLGASRIRRYSSERIRESRSQTRISSRKSARSRSRSTSRSAACATRSRRSRSCPSAGRARRRRTRPPPSPG